ncbi:hypothetical protein BIW11_13930 [Tropilaelaps mercedesae]|uniref:Uncharacterized protein n=1 Tax=Tropilaelaps mercedesae TaxID=418985 RepID=A0A1V9X034_9ACAR|nr:hypothetical protein BIW11_13930 [Tropilaelaps mercedesae]
MKDENSEERYVAVYVRAHKSLELQEDKSYIISCGKGNFRNARRRAHRPPIDIAVSVCSSPVAKAAATAEERRHSIPASDENASLGVDGSNVNNE